jgi:phage FluMu protein Com
VSIPPPIRLDAWRCPRCNTILAKMRLTPGSVIEIKCPRCNAMAIKEAA